MDIFDDDDAAYLAWLAAHPHGYVVNAARNGHYRILHRATCGTITNGPPNGDTWTAGQYIKVCALTPRQLCQWAGRPLPHCHAHGRNCFAE